MPLAAEAVSPEGTRARGERDADVEIVYWLSGHWLLAMLLAAGQPMINKQLAQ
jgi:hypothetical protein